MRPFCRLELVLSVAVLAVLTGCGAGLITGIASSGRSGRTPEARSPELSVAPVLPLVAPPNTTRSVVVANAQLAGASQLTVRIVAAGVEVDQLQPTAAVQGGSTLISFGVETGPIVAAVGDPTAADVPASLSVRVDGAAVAAAVPILLARQPRASLVLPPGDLQRFLSPLGERVMLHVDGLRSASPGDVQVLVTTRDPNGPPGPTPATVTRIGADLRFETPDGDVPVVSVALPGNAFPVAAELVVRDAVAGQSTAITNAYYRPDVALALPSQGPTTGGSLVTLIGTALVPHDFDAGAAPAPFDFDAVDISFAKGGRIAPLPREDFRIAESGSDRLVFTMPPSPDGRPGQVDIVLRVELGGVSTQVVASQKFLFANPDPYYGPRGAILDRLPVTVAAIHLDDAPGTDAAPDFVTLTEPGGVAFLQLLLAQQNGMFQPFAGPLRVGDPEVPAERNPRDLCVADFDGDGVPDVFVCNEGAATAVHHLVLGQARPLAPLGAVHRVPAAGGSWRCRAARFDGDALPDVLLVPGPNAPPGRRPQVLLSRPLGPGQPAFAPPIELPVRDFDYEAVEVADLDGDHNVDVALVSGTELKVDVAYGSGDGQFFAAVPLDVVVPGYTPAVGAPAVGLHACRDREQQSLCLVLAGLMTSFGGGPTQPTIAVLRQSAPRAFVSPTATGTINTPTEPIGQSLAADLDSEPPIELVVAMRDEPLFIALGLLQLGDEAFVPIGGSIEEGILGGAESPRQIRTLAFDTAFPASAPSGEAKAVFIVHETEIDGVRERRLSTRLVVSPSPQPLLLPPDAGDAVDFPIARLVGGNFHPVSVASGGAVRDLALVRRGGPANPEEIILVKNDGFGGFPTLTSRFEQPGLLPDSLTLVPAPPGVVDGLVFCHRDSRLAFWRHKPLANEQDAPTVTAPLRLAIPDPPLQAADLDDATRMQVADVDGDGVDDLVLVLSFAVPALEATSRIALCRGKPAPGPGEFPFWLPTQLTPVHGNASAFALADFAVGAGETTRRLELAVTVPVGSTATAVDGDHVRFYRYEPGATPADDRFVPSAVAGGPQVLLAGSQPAAIAAADLDRDGRVDLLLACRGDSTLRMFRNTAAPGVGTPEVQIGAFVESLSSPNPLAIGEPTLLRLSDVNGDQNLDAVVFVEFVSGFGDRSTTIATYLNAGTGEFTGPRFASRKRIGDRDAVLSGDLGDWNRDGVPDLFLGWDTSGPSDINLRVLFGGTR